MRKQNFTLIELLIVLVIIGVLALVALPLYQNYMLKTRKAEAVVITRSIAGAVEAYYIETGSFPPQQVGSALPTELGVSLPQNPTKYYWYLYQNVSGYTLEPDRVLVSIIASSLEGRFVNSYSIFYMYDTPTYNTWTGQAIDNHWYRYYADYPMYVPGGP